MKKWNLVIDLDRCNSCNNCVLATKDEHTGNRFEGYSEPTPTLGINLLQLRRHERGDGRLVDVTHYPDMCFHCDDAPCINDSTKHAIKKREDGIVHIDPKAARGESQLVDACPYGQIFWNKDAQLPQKWTFDVHLLDQGWTEPRCAQACPTEAIKAYKVADDVMADMIANDNLLVLGPRSNGRPTAPEGGKLGRPRVYYKNSRRLLDLFVAGSIFVVNGDRKACGAGLVVEFSSAGRLVGRATTDWSGDFKIDGINAEIQGGLLTVHDSAGHVHEYNVDLDGRSNDLGPIIIP